MAQHWTDPAVHHEAGRGVATASGPAGLRQPAPLPTTPAVIPPRAAVPACGPFIGRVLLAHIFLFSGAHKILDFAGTVGHLEGGFQRLFGFYELSSPAVDFLVSNATILLGIAVAFELGGGLSMLLGCKARWGAFMLLLFLVPTTLVFHSFWTFPAEEQQMQMINFMKNLAIMGGLLMVTSFGPGRFSVDGA